MSHAIGVDGKNMRTCPQRRVSIYRKVIVGVGPDKPPICHPHLYTLCSTRIGRRNSHNRVS